MFQGDCRVRGTASRVMKPDGGPCISIFGSASYQARPQILQARRGSRAPTAPRRGFRRHHRRGAPGIMEAGKQRAPRSTGGLSVGLNIDLPFEQSHKPVHRPGQEPQPPVLLRPQGHVRQVRTGFHRATWVASGPLDELFEVPHPHPKPKKITRVPVVLMGVEFLERAARVDPRETMLGPRQTSVPDDMDLLPVHRRPG